MSFRDAEISGEDSGYRVDMGAWGLPDPPSVGYEIAFWQMAYTRGASDRA